MPTSALAVRLHTALQFHSPPVVAATPGLERLTNSLYATLPIATAPANASKDNLLHRAREAVEFAPVEQQLAGAGRVGDEMRGGRWERRDQGAEQKSLAILEQHIAVHELGLAGAQAFDFPPFKHNTGFENFFDEVFMPRFFILRDGGVARIRL